MMGAELLLKIAEKYDLEISVSYKVGEREPVVLQVLNGRLGSLRMTGRTLESTTKTLDAFVAAANMAEPLGERDELPRSTEVTVEDRYMVAWILRPFEEIIDLPEETQHWIRTGEGKNVEDYNHRARRLAANRQDAIRKAKQG